LDRLLDLQPRRLFLFHLAVVWMGQELFLVRDDLRERVCVQYALLGLVRETGSGLVIAGSASLIYVN
jgi:hypothetical protein